MTTYTMVASGNAISLGANITANFYNGGVYIGQAYQSFESWSYNSGYYTTGYNSNGTAQISFSDVPVVQKATGGSTPINVQISGLYGAGVTAPVDQMALTTPPQQVFGCGPPGSSYYYYNLGNTAIAISGDGNTLITTYAGNYFSAISGVVLVELRNGSQWANTISYSSTIRDPTGASGTQIGFGDSIAISSDGGTIAVGAPLNNVANGAVWVYANTAGNPLTWTQQAGPLIDSSVINGYQGKTVSLCANGSILAISGSGSYDPGSLNLGADSPVWIWTRSGTTWTMQKKITVTGETGAFAAGFGCSISLSRDGSTLAVGGPVNNNGIGAVWIFINNSGTWTQQAILTGSGNSGASYQGYSVSLSANGNVLAVGGPYDGEGFIGKTWIWNRSGTTWTQVTTLVGTPFVYTYDATGFYNPFQGTSVSLSNTGNILAVSGGGSTYEGRFYIFKNNLSGTWSQFATHYYPGADIILPTVMCFSDNGNTLAVQDQGLGNTTGRVEIYV